MSNKMLKYQLETTDRQTIKLPASFKFRYINVQDGWITIWGEVNTDSSVTFLNNFYIVGTGQEISSTASTYLGSVYLDIFVWHVYSQYYLLG